MNAREQQIQALVEPTVDDLGLHLWGIELISQGKHTMLRVFIHKPVVAVEGAEVDAVEDESLSRTETSITVDDCANVSREISDLLDVEEVFNSAFTLEVSSPGMDCILFNEEQYLANVGQQIDVRLNAPFEGRKRITGLLMGVEDGEAVVRSGEDEYLLPLENVNRTRVVPQFDKQAKS